MWTVPWAVPSHSSHIAEHLTTGRLIGIDRDPGGLGCRREERLAPD